MRPQTTIALVVGAALGIGFTWFSLVRESTTIVTNSTSPPARERPADTRLKPSLSGASSSRENPDSDLSSGRHDDLENSMNGLARGTQDTVDQSGPGSGSSIDRDFSTPSAQVLRSTGHKDQIVSPTDDGSYSYYKRIQNLVIQTDYSASDVRLQSITYQIGPSGQLLSYEVLGGDRNKLYRASLGYSKRPGPTFGKIVQEKLFDVNELRYFDDPDESGRPEEKPVYMFVYSYNDDGTPNEPVGINMTKVQEDDSLIDFDGVLHMAVPYGRLPAHIVSALNKSYPIDPLIKP
ncbi:hypothetical protein ACFQY0_13700 [Haloferula chungangensis]|uniref:Uncharacterized protein n=1 Tax=Haloferula chungangensis TaxID=1048331 RepID=A0ABW2L981_9BACT